MTGYDVASALEDWTLQTLLDISIVLGIPASGIAIVHAYYQSLETRLSIRVFYQTTRR